ncbi:tyrosine-type recombinase/integrase [Companilactobacillus zhachilii]|nr:tyrosine-type recombinase/integrase [Companilactobacillus zhachilii]
MAKTTRIYKKQNTWAYRVFYKDDRGKERSINHQGFKRRSDAEDAAREIENRRAITRLGIADKISFAKYFESWINTYNIGRFSPSTDSKYQVALGFIQDYFFDDLLKDITKMEYQGFKYAQDHVKDSICRINGYIRSCIQEAVEERIIDRNFTRNVVITSKKKGRLDDVKYLEADVASGLKILAKKDATLSNISACEILFALGTGCRYSEIVGVTWNNIDFENHTVNIQKTYDYKKRTGFLPTKTESSVRQIKISDELTREL